MTAARGGEGGKLRVLSLFAGIGGFDLGLERTGGFETVAFCEIDPFCQRVLAKHWPGVPIYDDVRELTAERLAADGIAADVVCGGFPCQDISAAGKGAGIDGERSGLWAEMFRLIRELRPAFAVIENVPRLRTLGADRVLSDLEAIRYACEPAVVGAVHAGAPHRRQRAWLVAHPIGFQLRNEPWRGCGARWPGTAVIADDGAQGLVANSEGSGGRTGFRESGAFIDWHVVGDGGFDLADAARDGWRSRRSRRIAALGQERKAARIDVSNAEHSRCQGRDPEGRRTEAALPHGWWAVEPDVGRVAHGVPSRVDRLRSIGNAVVPQIPELIGHAILATLHPNSSHSRTLPEAGGVSGVV